MNHGPETFQYVKSGKKFKYRGKKYTDIKMNFA